MKKINSKQSLSFKTTALKSGNLSAIKILLILTLGVLGFKGIAQTCVPTMYHVAGTSSGGYSGDGGPATAAGLYEPSGLFSDGVGNVYVADRAYIRKINTSGIISTIAGNGTLGSTGDGGPATAAEIYIQYGAVDKYGNIFLACGSNYTIRKVNTSGIITTIAGSGTAGFAGDGGPATAALLNSITGLACDTLGNVFIADQGNHRIRQINTSGIISTIAGNGTSGITGNGGSATAAEFIYCSGIACDKNNNLYFIDFGEVRKINSSGTISAFAGGTYMGYSGDGGPATAATIDNGASIAADLAGNVYFADQNNSVVRKVDAAGIISTYAGNDSFATMFPYSYGAFGVGDGGPATLAPIDGTNGLTTDLSGNLYISGNLTLDVEVKKVTPGMPAISGINQICVGNTSSLSDPGTGGTWSSSSSSIATVGTSGVVTGMAAGTATITYTLGACYATMPVTVSAAVAAITGPSSICVGSVMSLSDATIGGTWTSSSPANATIGSGTGLVSGITIGSATITYSSGSGCYTTKSVTVNAALASITGPSTLCDGAIITLSDATTGGTWSSSTIPVATVSSGGVVVGLISGVTTISYTVGSCYATHPVTVFANPAAIGGTLSVCIGSTTTLSDSYPGGAWSSSTTGIATIGSSTGIVTGITAGVTTISYTITGGCFATNLVTVNPLPYSIVGPPTVCVGSSDTLSDAFTGGTFSSGNPSVATINAITGVLTGVAAGTTNITYTSPAGCIAYSGITVNPLPAAITGAFTICQGNTTILSDTSASGTWSSTTPGIATIGSSTGVVTGTASGTSVISYTSGIGCSAVATFTVNPLPPAISGPSLVCLGTTITLTDAGGGVWSSSNPTVASVGSSTGIVTGNAIGTAIITYALSTGCMSTLTVTVGSAPSPISGPTTICAGIPASLTSPGGGIWTSSVPATATIGSLSGIINGVVPGTTTITYSLGSCSTSETVTVNPSPAPITGVSAICAGYYIVLSDASPGGTWSSSSSGVATVGSTGIVYGVTTGIATITYTLGTGCYTTKAITVNPIPVISGTPSVCIGSTTTLSGSVYNIWSSGSLSIATVGSSSGVVTGIAAGTATITNTVSTGCYTTIVVTVNSTPAPISGPTSVCAGSTITLTGSGGGTWSSSLPGVGTVNPSTGIVSGISAGVTTISYTLGTGCNAIYPVTVNPSPAAISGPSSVCVGSTIGLIDLTSGGTWSLSSTLYGSIASTGIYSGISAGTSTITYSLGTGCYATAPVTVNSSPSPIVGITSVCVGSGTSLTNDSTGGTWSSGTTTVATIGSTTGLYSGLTTGTSVISYTLGDGCSTSVTVTVSTAPSAISGPNSVCSGSTITLTDGGGGLWISGTISVATIGSLTGIVTGVTPGTTTITYSLGTGCTTSIVVTVNPLPSAISGPSSLCTGASATLTDAGGGTWSSSSTVCVIGSSSGVVTGFIVGVGTITYTLSTGCFTTRSETVNPLPSVISGTATVCEGATTTLTNSVSGGTWSSSSTGIASIGTSSGVVSGVSAGTATISYTLSTGCFVTTVVTVNPLPATISGPASICIGVPTTYTDAIAGGTWTSSILSVAIVSSTSGVVTGISTGITSLIYTLPSGCSASKPVTVNPLPVAISGPSSLCDGASATFTDAPGGGTWTSSAIPVATVGTSSGLVTGIAAGSAIISYTLSTGCYAIKLITVNGLPASISGTASVCVGSTTTLTDAGGGTWSSSTTGVATIGTSTGIVSGLSSGTSTITYTLPTGCQTSEVVTVNPLPSSITGASALYIGSAITLSDGTSGGSWSSSNTSIAAVGSSTGVVTGVAGGSATITYALGTGCHATTSVSVTGSPAPISGASAVCEGSTITLTDASTGGTWSSTDITIATVGSSTGIVTGVSGGTVTIAYTVSGISASIALTVTPIPAAIAGPTTVCSGSTITLTDAASGGTWTSSSPTTATIGSSSGLITGVATGTVTITYSTGCGTDATFGVTVNPTPDAGAISGASVVYTGSTITLSETVTGGTWTSDNISVATIGSSTGIVTGIATGTANISYGITGCGLTSYATYAITDSPVNRISGNINFGAGAIDSTGTLMVWLITYDTSSGILTAVDSITMNVNGTSIYYQFLGEPVDSFRVKAAYYPATFSSTGYVPTYHTSAFYWHDANVLWHTAGSDDGTDITMGYGTVSTGPGFISGYVTTGANKGTAGAAPAAGLLMFVKNSAGTILQQTYTDTGGAYAFSNLAIGQVYTVYPEALNYASTAYTSIDLTTSDTATDINFVKHTISHSITPILVGVKPVASPGTSMIIFPNPTDAILNLKWQVTATEKGEVTITDLLGRQVYTNTILLTEGNGTSQIDLSGFTSGSYIISIKSANINYTNKVQLLLTK